MTSKAKALYQDYLFPGVQQTLRCLSLHWEDYFNTPGAKAMAIVLHAFHFVVPWLLIQKFYPLIEPYFTNPETNGYAVFTVFMISSVGTLLFANLLFSLLYTLRIPWVEKFKCNDEAWPWVTDPVAHRKLWWR
jgi:hypothetical protein